MKTIFARRIYIKIFLILNTVVFFSSCISYEKVRYFENISSGEEYKSIKSAKNIGPYDKLYIKVFGLDEKTAKIFNGGEANSGFMNVNLLSFVVNDHGEIAFPFVGLIKVSGMTVESAAKEIKNKLNDYVVNSDVTVKFVENRVSVLGEVQRQGDYTFYEDKLSVFQVLAMAGGLTKYADHKKIVLMRKYENTVKYYTIDLGDKKGVQNDYYYLTSNDVIIVEPLKDITRTYENASYSKVLSTLSTVAAIASVILTYSILKK